MSFKPVYSCANHVGPRLERLVIKASDYNSGFCLRNLLDGMLLAVNQTAFVCDHICLLLKLHSIAVAQQVVLHSPTSRLSNSCIYRNPNPKP